MTKLLDEQEANTPLLANKINNTVYTGDLTTSRARQHGHPTGCHDSTITKAPLLGT
jgi:hypothetical protein